MQAGADPGTVYLVAYLSRKYGPVFVVRGKMPTFPDTFAGADGKGLATMPPADVQYWSLVTLASAPSGELWDGVFDMQVPLDRDGNYTIVVSRPEDRPKNATLDHGVAWIDWGPGEGLNDQRNRKDWGMLLVRIMSADPKWEDSPTKIVKPGMEAEVLGPYYPRRELPVISIRAVLSSPIRSRLLQFLLQEIGELASWFAFDVSVFFALNTESP